MGGKSVENNDGKTKLGGEMGETAQGVEFYFQVMELFWKSINKKW